MARSLMYIWLNRTHKAITFTAVGYTQVTHAQQSRASEEDSRYKKACDGQLFNVRFVPPFCRL